MRQFKTSPGKPDSLGASIQGNAVQFAIFSRHATGITLCLFDKPEDSEPAIEIKLDKRLNRTGEVWHILLEGLKKGVYYLYRAEGPYEPQSGHRFNPNKLLLDPYARAVTGNFDWNLADSRGYDPGSSEKDISFSTISDAAGMPKCIIYDDNFEWQGDRPLNYPLRECVIYETHVRGLTLHKSANVKHQGTFRGVVEKIPYFKDLGITTLELLPIQEFDELEVVRKNPLTGKSLQNYWGYSTMLFFAPKGRYSSTGTLGEQITEFKEMVRELHGAGIEVVLDVVFNHTAEGDETGPTLCFRGLDNAIYYMLDETNPRFYKNYSGCGNTFNCNHPVVRNLIMDCLHYWVVEMHVDGFRFDLASILGRGQNGRILENPPIIERIAEDPILRDTKIIAEAWDMAGAYQVGAFPGGRWAEWNDRFRDDIRRYWRSEQGMVPPLATRITGSSDLYLRDGRRPFHSINFITAHDGFTLNDLVSYNEKHNEANGEENRDGNNYNLSYNCGAEGETSDPGIQTLRNRQVKNFIATLFLSQGTPMLLGGDEFRRTQKGNNNAYCQNNEISWYHWTFKERFADVFRFCSGLIHFRKAHPVFRRPVFFTGRDTNLNSIPDIAWYSPSGAYPDWHNVEMRSIAFLLDGSNAEIEADRDDNDFFIMFNSWPDDVQFTIPSAPGEKRWFLAIDTSCDPPLDISNPGEERTLHEQSRYTVKARSMAVLLSKHTEPYTLKRE
ncbi:glycogen debranching protein GlgX [bacterium]|nr:glycogen debranching protein GlgX [bacterium]